jgi:ligand-binding sensor domain-containing protein
VTAFRCWLLGLAIVCVASTVTTAARPHPAAAPAALAASSTPAAAPAASDSVKPSKHKLDPKLRFDRVTGMAKGAVKAIAQDDTGFMWFGTDEGLSRYDGYDFVNYVAGPDQQNTLSDFTVTSLAISEGALWIGTVKGLDRLDLRTKVFTHYKANPQNAATTVASDFITSLYMGKNGILWIGTNDAGVDSLNTANGEIHHYKSDAKRVDVSEDEIAAVRETKDGKIWIGTREAGLRVLDPATGKSTRYVADAAKDTTLSTDKVTSIFEDSEGTMWIGTADGLNRFDAANKNFRHYISGNEEPITVYSVAEGVDGGLWLAMKDRVNRFDRKTAVVETYQHDGTDPTTIVNQLTWAVFSDRSGVLWFGGDAGGVSKLPPIRRQLTLFEGTDPGLSFLEDGDQVWIGTISGGLRSFNTKNGEVKHYLDDVLGTTYTDKIVAGDGGSLWIATTDKGMFHFTPRTGDLETYDTESRSLPDDHVFALLPDGDMLWVGTFGAGLVRFDPRRHRAEHFTSNASAANSLSSDNITALYQDPTHPDTLWVGTAGGLNAFDKRTAKSVRYLHDPANPATISHDRVTDIHVDKSGRMWVATWGGGLDRFDPKTGAFTAYHTTQGIASEVVLGILEDKSGNLWLTTNNGLTKFDPAKQTTVTLRASDGLQDDDFGVGSFYQGPSGRFFVGGPRGFNMFVPEDVKLDTYAPPVVLTEYKVLGEARPIPAEVSLKYRERGFSLTYAGLDYVDPSRNRYKVRLRGLDDDWVESDRRFVSYSSLPPGDYTLEIIGANEHGQWADHGVSLPVHVPPVPWLTWWAFCVYGVLAALIAVLFWRRHRVQLEGLRRTHRLSELEREMALSSAVQEGFFPPERSVRDGVFGLEAFYRAAAQCGGDWWSYEASEESYFVVVGDATGHGVGSAMVTAAAASTFRSLGSNISYDNRLQAMNDEVLRVSRGQYHMTLTAVEINVMTGEYIIRSAGGVPVFALAAKARPRVLMCPGTPLGSPDFEVGQLEGQLAPGERLVILTDGIPEVALANQQLLGPRGVANFCMQTRELGLEIALQQLVAKVEAVNASVQDDDWTVVMVQWGDPVVIEHGDPTTMVGARSTVTKVASR